MTVRLQCGWLLAAASLFACGGQGTSSTSSNSEELRSGAGPEVSSGAHAVSGPVRDMPEAPRFGLVNKEHPVKPLPLAARAEVDDPVVQNSILPLITTSAGLNFAGVGNGDYGFAPDAAPPDTNGAAGATQYVQWVNESFAVFDKATGT